MQSLIALADANPFWMWTAFAAAILALEVATGTGWMLWPAASAAVVAALVLFAPLPDALAVGLFAVLTLVSTLLAHRFWPRRVEAPGDDINDNSARLIGHHGRAVQAFRERAGRVFIDGKEWAAELEDGEVLDAGTPVEVTGVRGAHLKVRAAL
jgi:membrane protein implicated in regulation of membrane protease activity